MAWMCPGTPTILETHQSSLLYMMIIYYSMNRFPEGLTECTGFDWDEGNTEKIQERHGVSPSECEQVFFQRPLLVAFDREHSRSEIRYAALGKTAANRQMTLVFTVRDGLVRVISARAMSRRERRVYERE